MLDYKDIITKHFVFGIICREEKRSLHKAIKGLCWSQ